MIENRITIHKDGKQYEIIPNRILEYEIKNNLSLNGFLFVVKLQDKDWTLQDNLGIGVGDVLDVNTYDRKEEKALSFSAEIGKIIPETEDVVNLVCTLTDSKKFNLIPQISKSIINESFSAFTSFLKESAEIEASINTDITDKTTAQFNTNISYNNLLQTLSKEHGCVVFFSMDGKTLNIKNKAGLFETKAQFDFFSGDFKKENQAENIMPIDDNEFDEQFKNNGFVSFDKTEGFKVTKGNSDLIFWNEHNIDKLNCRILPKIMFATKGYLDLEIGRLLDLNVKKTDPDNPLLEIFQKKLVISDIIHTYARGVLRTLVKGGILNN